MEASQQRGPNKAQAAGPGIHQDDRRQNQQDLSLIILKDHRKEIDGLKSELARKKKHCDEIKDQLERQRAKEESIYKSLNREQTENQSIKKNKLLKKDLQSLKKITDEKEQYLSERQQQANQMTKLLSYQRSILQKAKVQYQNKVRKDGLNNREEEERQVGLNINKDQEIRLKKEALAKIIQQNQVMMKELHSLPPSSPHSQQMKQQLQSFDQKKSQNESLILMLRGRLLQTGKKTKQSGQLIAQRQNQIVSLQEELSQIHRQLAVKKEPSRQRQQVNIPKPIGHLFAGDILDDDLDSKQYLKDMLERQTRAKIARTKLIYRYDPLNKNNIHKYIDQKEQLVVIVRLVNGFTFGAWTEGSFRSKEVSKRDGLIFSVTNRKVFELLKSNCKAITYDDYFVIFGSSELRLKTQDTKVFSNFGINNAYYHSHGKNVDVLLGSGKDREVELQSYEFYQLVFE